MIEASPGPQAKSDPQSNFARDPVEDALLLSMQAYGGTDYKDLGVLEFLDRSHRIECVAVAIIGINENADIARARNASDLIRELRERLKRLIG